MKKFLLIFLFITSYGFAQNSGITYQAVIYNPNGEELPGVNNPYAALTEQSVCLQFGIVDASGTIEYQENVQVTTDVFGMVNLLIGTYPQTSGYAASFSDINWGSDAKFLKVDIDINGDCTNFKELSNQPFTYVPFAYYSPASDTPGPAGEDGNGIVNTINNTDNTITFEYTDGTSFTTDSLNGEDGGSGLSAYEVWIGLGNTGTEQEFIDSLNGEDGSGGLSAYEVWTGLGNTGTEQEFIDSLTGSDGVTGVKSLINTSEEPAGPNCDEGGSRIEVGIDTNNNNILDPDEIDTSLTRYICNGEVAIKTLINSITEEPGDNCTNGGVKIEVGEDTNANNILDTDEVDSSLTKYVCNGNDGEGGSGFGNFTGDNLVPEEIITVSSFGTSNEVSSYTIPNGKYAKISAILGIAAPGGGNQVYPGFTDLKLTVNGVETFIGGSGVSPLIGGNGNDEQMFSDALYFPSNTVLEIGFPAVSILFLEVYSLNNFIPKIITSEVIVPEGKKWKVTNIMASQSIASASSFNHGPGNEIFINNISIMANGGNLSSNGNSSGFDVVSFANSSFWIPEGTVLAPGRFTFAVNVLEFDSSLSSISNPDNIGGSAIECTTGGALDYGDDYVAGTSLTDNNGNIYETVEICGQTWTTSNLDVSTYRDGTPIPHITDYDEWYNATTGAYTYALQDGTLGWGKLYNSYAILGVDDDDPNTPNKELAPEGYHIPSSLEWNQLFLIYNDSQTAHSYLRSETSWTLNGNNESGLNIIRASIVNSIFNSTTGNGFYTLTETELPNCQANLYEYTVFASRTINEYGVQGVAMNGCNMYAQGLDYSGPNHAQSSGYLGAYIRLLKD